MDKTPLFFRPVQTNKITQTFGQNNVCARTMPGGFPRIPYQLINKIGGVCPQGSRDFYKLLGVNGHTGIDQAAFDGEPTYHCALFGGRALKPQDHPNGKPDTDGGLKVISNDPVLECKDGCPAGTMHHIIMRYAHGVMKVEDGASISPGDFVQTAGNIGSSTGIHVHWSARWCDENGNVLHLDNGYQGAFDPAPYFTNIFILGVKPRLVTRTPNSAEIKGFRAFK